MVISVSKRENGISRHEETFAVSIQNNSKITMHKFRVKSICYLFCGKFYDAIGYFGIVYGYFGKSSVIPVFR